MFGMGPQELLVFGVIAILLFGKKLPDIARKVGGSYKEFRKGMNEVKTSYRDTTSGYMDDVNSNYSAGSGYAGQEQSGQGDYEEATAPKFEPPPVEPQVEQADPADENANAADEASAD